MIGFTRRSLILVSVEPTTDRVSSSVLGTLVDRSGRELNHTPHLTSKTRPFWGVVWGGSLKALTRVALVSSTGHPIPEV